jgi:HSP20 family molecular chaperone IbpA
MPPSRDLEAWMWAEAVDALSRAERLHREFFRLGRPSAKPTWEPPVDIFESGRELWILAALPGLGIEEVEIGVESGVLVIAGDRHAAAARRATAIHRLEIPQGRFERRIGLPAGKFDLARRDMDHGVLTLVLRRLD